MNRFRKLCRIGLIGIVSALVCAGASIGLIMLFAFYGLRALVFIVPCAVLFSVMAYLVEDCEDDDD